MAGLAIAIPILIHLFNLRRYKTVYFPSTRFLKNIQLHSQKQSQLRYKWLLAARILFLLLLVLAFAQPFFKKDIAAGTDNKLKIIYIDNSASMSLKSGARNLLDIAKDAARKQLLAGHPDARYLVISNDKPMSYQPMPADKAMNALDAIELSMLPTSSERVFATVQGLLQTEAVAAADVFYYSDFQRNSFRVPEAASTLQGVRFVGIPVRSAELANVFIDTAFLASPVLQSGQTNMLVVKTKFAGKRPDEAPVIQLSVNGQVKSAVSVVPGEGNEQIDTLSFQPEGNSWQRISLAINDAAARFDDTFRIAARSASSLSVLVLNQGQSNPFIHAAVRTYDGFRVDQRAWNDVVDWKGYDLVIVNGATIITEAEGKRLGDALQQGQSICIFPGKTGNIDQLNRGLSQMGDLRITSIDTAAQTAAAIQQGSELVRDLFERIPENVQLPVANWHYRISAGLTANQQSVLSFRNGDPLLAQYAPSRGKLYLLATAADATGGNFTGSYFFVPFLYQMARQAKSGDVFALAAGSRQPVSLSMKQADDRQVVHVYAPGIDIIPPQRPNGTGLDVFVNEVVHQPGFYTLAAAGMDSTVLALNHSREESLLELWDMTLLQKSWSGPNVLWQTPNTIPAASEQSGAIPLWKVCVILALLMLAAETYFLSAGYRKPTAAPR